MVSDENDNNRMAIMPHMQKQNTLKNKGGYGNNQFPTLLP